MHIPQSTNTPTKRALFICREVVSGKIYRETFILLSMNLPSLGEKMVCNLADSRVMELREILRHIERILIKLLYEGISE